MIKFEHTDVYCGPVGGENRYEFAVMGPTVNLAARLMCSEKNPGILVDNAVRKIAAQSFSFNALEPVVAKGYVNVVPIFEPLANRNRVCGKLEPNFAGRENEVGQLISMAREFVHATKRVDSKLVVVSGPSGLGKTTLLAQAVYEIRRNCGFSSGLIVAEHAGLECDILTPFSTIRFLLFKIIQYAKTPGAGSDDMSCVSGMTGALLHDDRTVRSDDSNRSGLSGRFIDFLMDICNEQNYPEMIMELGKQYLFGSLAENALHSRPKLKHTIMATVASYIANVLIRCIRDVKLVLIVLDDVHRADECSWRVLQHVFQVTANVMVVGATHSISNYSIRVPVAFWNKLNGTYSNRFIKLELEKLSEEEVLKMTMKTLGLRQTDVKREIINEVLVQSGGTPRFAAKFLEGIKERLYTNHPVASLEDESVREIILHRIDSFDIAIRGVLNIGAILGSSFTYGELIKVLLSNKDAKEDDIRKEAIESLKTIVKDGILRVGDSESDQDPSTITEDDNTKFNFYRTVWQTTILGLMLVSRKKDVHKRVALSLENSAENEKTTAQFHQKLFTHWKATGDTEKSTVAALRAGKFFEEDKGHPNESISIYEDALGMWGMNDDDFSAGSERCSQILNLINAIDLSQILSLSVARGRALRMANKHSESVRAYESAIRIKYRAKASPQLKDRSIIFPSYVGISNAIAEGCIHQDVYRRYEQGIIHQFLDETRIHGRLIHHIYALFLQMDLYSNQGELDKSIAVQSIIKKLYKPDKHSKGLTNVYGIDAGALSFSLCSYFYMMQKNNRQALRTARFVLKELFPKIEATFNQSFALIYPIVFVLKETGFAAEARAFFEKLIISPFKLNVRGIQSNVLTIYKPLGMLLDLSTKGRPSSAIINDCFEWTTDKSRLFFGERVNLHLSRLGHSADSISAEICAGVAATMEAGKSRNELVKLGLDVINKAILFLRKNGLHAALKQAHEVRNKLERLSATRGHAKKNRCDPSGGLNSKRLEGQIEMQ